MTVSLSDRGDPSATQVFSYRDSLDVQNVSSLLTFFKQTPFVSSVLPSKHSFSNYDVQLRHPANIPPSQLETIFNLFLEDLASYIPQEGLQDFNISKNPNPLGYLLNLSIHREGEDFSYKIQIDTK